MITKTFSADTTTPVRAYAALCASTPGRSSFLLEALGEARWAGRYSLVGHRARAESLYPGLDGDVFPTLAGDLGGAPGLGDRAARFARACVGYIAYDAVHRIFGHEPWPDETDVARFMRDATVALFDHGAHTITVAGQSQGAVERCAYEMMRGPELAPLAVPEDALPDHFSTPWSDGLYLSAVRRGIEATRAGQVERIVLARSFVVPQRDATPLDAYRALRLLAPDEATYLLDFAESPIAPGLVVFGSAKRVLFATPPGETDPELLGARAAFPGAEFLGSPTVQAAAWARDLEPMSRGPWGGAVGFLLRDGEVHLVPATTAIVLRQSQFRVTAAAQIDGTMSPEGVLAATHDAARRPLRALRAALGLAAERAARAEAEAAAKEGTGA